MEIQWPLVLFTTFIAASAGLFATAGVYAAAGKGQRAQMPALIASFALMVVGGVAVFFHLQHWERIFNGFGHLSSGITQELIGLVALFVVMVVFFVQIRRGAVARWAGVLAVVVACALVFVMAHSYLMPSRPAWDNALQVASLFGAALAFGPAAFAALDAKAEEDFGLHGVLSIAGTAAGALATVGYLVAMNGATSSFAQVSTYLNPTDPTVPIVAAESFSPFAGDAMGLAVGAIVLACAAVAAAVAGRATKKWLVWGAVACACAFVAAILLRMVFYVAGGSVFMYY